MLKEAGFLKNLIRKSQIYKKTWITWREIFDDLIFLNFSLITKIFVERKVRNPLSRNNLSIVCAYQIISKQFTASTLDKSQFENNTHNSIKNYFSIAGYYFPLYIGCIANGIAILVSENYINLRASKITRSARIALCYLLFFIGLFTLGVLFSRLLDTQDDLNVSAFNRIIGIILISYSSIAFVLVIFNGVQQISWGFYDYKECLDADTNDASNSREIYLQSYKRYHVIYIIFMIFTKCMGFVVFHYMYFRLSHEGTISITGRTSQSSVFLLFSILGSALTTIFIKKYSSKKIFLISSGIMVLSIILVLIFKLNGNYSGVGGSLWVFYCAGGAVYSIPSQHILEITNLKLTEIAQTIGYLIELLVIAAIQYQELYSVKIDNSTLVSHTILILFIVITSCAVTILHMPNTFRRSHVEIRNCIANFSSYFVFRNKFHNLNSI